MIRTPDVLSSGFSPRASVSPANRLGPGKSIRPKACYSNALPGMLPKFAVRRGHPGGYPSGHPRSRPRDGPQGGSGIRYRDCPEGDKGSGFRDDQPGGHQGRIGHQSPTRPASNHPGRYPSHHPDHLGKPVPPQGNQRMTVCGGRVAERLPVRRTQTGGQPVTSTESVSSQVLCPLNSPLTPPTHGPARRTLRPSDLSAVVIVRKELGFMSSVIPACLHR